MASNWWEDPNLIQSDLGADLRGIGVPALNGRRLGSFRLQNEARRWLQQRALEERLAALQGGGQMQQTSPLTPLLRGAGNQSTPIPTPPLIEKPKPRQARPEWDKPGTPLGTFSREWDKGDLLGKGAAVLGLAGTALDALAQGTEGTIGAMLAAVPQVQISGGVQVKPSLQDQAIEQGRTFRQALGGQDFTQRYRGQANWAEKPFEGADDPATWAFYQTRNIAYSGAGNQQRAMERVLAGENPTVAMRGLQAPAADAFDDEIVAYQTKVQEYVDSAGRRARAAALQVKQLPDKRWGSIENYANAMEKQARENAAQWVQGWGRIPGEQDPTKEMMGHLVVDPLNLPAVNKAQEILLAPAMGKLKGTTQATQRVATVYNDTLKREVTAMVTGINPRVQAVGERLGQQANPVLKALGGAVNKGINVFAFTPDTQAKVLTGTAWKQLGDLASAAENGAQMRTWLDALVDNPQALVETFGNGPVSVEAEAVRPLLKETRAKLGKLASTGAEEWNPATFLEQADDVLTEAARKLAKVPEKAPTWQRWASAAKAVMSEFYLRTPGYAVRNFLSDSAIGTMDGLRMFENMGQVERELQQFGVTTRRMAVAAGGLGEEIGARSLLEKVPVVGAIQTKIGQIADKGERARYTRAFWSALKDGFGTNWKPQLSRETADLFGVAGRSDVAEALAGALKGARSQKDIRRIVFGVLDAQTPAERFYVTRFAGADDLPAEVAATIERDVRRMYTDGASADDVNRYLDDWRQRLSDHTKSRLVDLGPLTTPRATTEADAMLDIDNQVSGYQRDLGRLVNHGDMTQADAQAALGQFRQELESQARQVAQARRELAEALAGADDLTDEQLAAVLHAVDGEYDIRNGTRPAVDKLRTEAWRSAKKDKALWEQYRQDVARVWGEASNQTIERYKRAAQVLGELRGGANPAEVLAKYGIDPTSARAEKALNLARPGADTYDWRFWLGAAQGEGLNEAETVARQMADNARVFDESLAGYRQRWDAARNESRRRMVQATRANPSLGVDMLDVFRSAERDTQRRWDQYIAKKYELLARKDAGEITLEQYDQLLGEEAKAAFEYSIKRHGELLTAQLEGVEIGRSEIAKRLKDLGYQPADVKRLVLGVGDGSTREEVAAILKEGKRAGPSAAEVAARDAEHATMRAEMEAQERRAKLVMEPPADADAFMALSPTPPQLDEALADARTMREQARQLAEGAAITEARRETLDNLPDVAEINRHLRPDGTLKPGDKGDAIREMSERFGVTFRDDVPGGAEENFRQWLEDSRRTRQNAAKGTTKGTDQAYEAYQKWGAIEDELLARMQREQNMAAEVAAMQVFVREQVQETGLAGAAETVRAIASGGTPQDEAMLAELAQVAREQAVAAMDLAPDVATGFEQAERILADALFGMTDGMDRANAMAAFARQAGVPIVPGLEQEMRVENIRNMATALGLNPNDLVRGERTATQMIGAARANAGAEVVDAVLKAATTNQQTGDQIAKVLKAEDWAQLRARFGGVVDDLAQRVAGATTYDDLAQRVGDAATVAWNSDPTGVYVMVNNRKAGINLSATGRSKDEAAADLARQLQGRKPTSPLVAEMLAGERKGPGEMIRKLAQPAPAEVSQAADVAVSIDDLSGEQLAELDRLVEQTPDSQAWGVEDAITAAERQQVGAIDRIKAGMGTLWNAPRGAQPLPAGARQAMEREVQRLAREFNGIRAASIRHAEARANFSLLDYGQKRGFDMYLAAFAPYSFWGTRQGRNFAVRMLEKPQILGNYMKYKRGMEAENQRRGYRQRFSGGWEIPLGDGQYSVFVDPMSMLFPFADLVNTNFDDAGDSKSALAQVYDMAGALGLRPAPWIDLPVRASNLLVDAQPGTPEYEEQMAGYGRGSIGNLIPQTNLIKGATAVAGIGAPGGIDIERPVRRMFGFPEAQPFEPYIVARSVRDLAAEAQTAAATTGAGFDNKPYLLAQAIVADRGGQTSGWGELLESATSGDIAKDFGVSLAEAQQAMQIVREAAARAGKEKGVRTLAGMIGGQRVQVMSPGERQFLEMQRTERAAAFNPLTGQGSRAEVMAAREAMPALAVGRAQYATLPGESTDPMQTYASEQRAEVNRQFDLLRDALIAQKPWDRKATYAAEDARAEALGTLTAGQAGEGGEGWRTAYNKAVAAITGANAPLATTQEYRPRSIAGANPAEQVQIRKDEVMRMVTATRPQYEQFATSGGAGSGVPDYAAYKAAVAQWETNLGAVAAALPQVGQVISQAESEGHGQEIREFLTGVSADDVQAYWRRNDSPVEAAQRAWFEAVYEPAVSQAKAGTRINEARLPAVGPTSTDDLVGLVMKLYGDRWGREELRQRLGTMTMPALKDVVRAQMTPAARGKAEQADQFRALVADKWGERGARALAAYEAATTTEEKQRVRNKYRVLARILQARTEFNKAAEEQ